MDYTHQHNQVASIIHWDICCHFWISVESRWYRHHPDRLVETDDITMVWDTTILTARKIGANRPDICLRNKKTNTCLLFPILFPILFPGNIARKQAEKTTKYSDLRVEVSRMWQCRPLVVPVVLGALGTVHVGIACMVAGHYSRSSQPAALIKQCFLDLVGSYVKSCLLSRQPWWSKHLWGRVYLRCLQETLRTRLIWLSMNKIGKPNNEKEGTGLANTEFSAYLTKWHFSAERRVANWCEMLPAKPLFPLHSTTLSNRSRYSKTRSDRWNDDDGRLTTGKEVVWYTARASNSLSVTTN